MTAELRVLWLLGAALGGPPAAHRDLVHRRDEQMVAV